jgi:putative sterol carrier protein
MADATEAFFARLSGRGHEPMLRRTTASIRIDLTGGNEMEHWFIAIKHGDVAITRADGPADLVLLTDRGVFEDLAAGRLNPMAATLRGLIGYEGDPALMVRLQRVFPAPTAPPLGVAAGNRAAGKRRG